MKVDENIQIQHCWIQINHYWSLFFLIRKYAFSRTLAFEFFYSSSITLVNHQFCLYSNTWFKCQSQCADENHFFAISSYDIKLKYFCWSNFCGFLLFWLLPEENWTLLPILFFLVVDLKFSKMSSLFRKSLDKDCSCPKSAAMPGILFLSVKDGCIWMKTSREQ